MATIEVEQAAYDAMRQELLADGHEGEFVLFKEGEVLGFFEAEGDAYSAGLERFGLDAEFLIARVEPEAPARTVPARP